MQTIFKKEIHSFSKVLKNFDPQTQERNSACADSPKLFGLVFQRILYLFVPITWQLHKLWNKAADQDKWSFSTFSTSWSLLKINNCLFLDFWSPESVNGIVVFPESELWVISVCVPWHRGTHWPLSHSHILNFAFLSTRAEKSRWTITSCVWCPEAGQGEAWVRTSLHTVRSVLLVEYPGIWRHLWNGLCRSLHKGNSGGRLGRRNSGCPLREFCTLLWARRTAK